MSVQTPVVLFAFNRPATTARVMAAVRAAAPTRLLLVCDGPRADRATDAERVAEVRALLAQVDWPCQVERLYAETNMGCRARISSGIAWAFERVDEAIFLEDDTLPDPTFFPYCEAMLARHRDDDRFLMASGFNLLGRGSADGASYWYSAHPRIWGWASTRRAWSGYDAQMTDWPAFRTTAAWAARTEAERAAWGPFFDAVKDRVVDTWDAQATLHAWRSGRLTTIPAVNLVQNIGLGIDATNTGAGAVSLPDVQALTFPLVHPAARGSDAALDAAWVAAEYPPPVRGVRVAVRGALHRLRRMMGAS